MQILSFDTSGSDVQIALMQDGRIVYEQKHPPAQKNRQESASMLLPAVDSALAACSWGKRELDLIVVGVGPGSFTGVRIAVIAARSIAQALELGVVPVSSLQVMARHQEPPCAVIVNAGAGKYYLARFVINGSEGDSTTGAELLEPYCGTPAEINERISDLHNIVLEAGLERVFDIEERLISIYPSANNLAAIAAQMAYEWISKDATKLMRESLATIYPWDNVLPLYLRGPSVTLKAENGSSIKTTAGS